MDLQNIITDDKKLHRTQRDGKSAGWGGVSNQKEKSCNKKILNGTKWMKSTTNGDCRFCH